MRMEAGTKRALDVDEGQRQVKRTFTFRKRTMECFCHGCGRIDLLRLGMDKVWERNQAQEKFRTEHEGCFNG